MRQFLSLLVALFFVAACHAAPPSPILPADQGSPGAQARPAPALRGQVSFGDRQAQVTMPDIVGGATVSLINTGTDQTVSTALTDSAGNFILSFSNGYVADPSATYYLEANKGLGASRPTHDAVRVRTIVKYADGWTSLTNTTPNTGILVTPATTALAIGAALRHGTEPFDFGSLVGRLSGAGSFTPVARLSGDDFAALGSLVDAILASDLDPVMHIGLSLPNTWRRLHETLSFTSLAPTSGGAGTAVALAGSGFSTAAADNTVTFNGVAASVSTATSARLDTTVPTGATSGPTSVRVGSMIVLGPNFTVPVVVSQVFPSTGAADTVVTLSGSGFSAVPAENVVTFSGVTATVTAASPTQLTVRVPQTTTGTVKVAVSGQQGEGGNFTYETTKNPFLARLNPPLASPGMVMTLEGTFGETVTVHFPGDVSASAVVLGPHRAQVIVPPGVRSGKLSVTTRGLTINVLSFRTPAFPLGLQRFQPRNAQTDVARRDSMLQTGRHSFASAVIGDSLYALGGYGISSSLTSVERAVINADGTLGSFSDAGVSLLTARSYFGSVVAGNHLYVLGGYGNGNRLNKVERAFINADGSLGTFSDAGVTLQTGRQSFASAVIGNFLYVVGGSGDAGTFASVERAVIQADGTLGAFTDAGVSLQVARDGHTSAVIGNFLYVFGGYGSGGRLASVERALIHADGSLGAFTDAGVSLQVARDGHTSTVIGHHLYVLGGFGSGGRLASVERALIHADGSLGAFTAAGALHAARTGLSSALVGDHLYVLGGSGSSASALRTVERASINASGALGTFSNSGRSLGDVYYRFTSAIVGRYLYLMGGSYSMHKVERASIDTDGMLGALTAAGVTLNPERGGHSSAVIGNKLYAIGGEVSGQTERLTNVAYALIQADGTLGAFSTAGASLETARSSHRSVVIGDKLYVLGGRTSDLSYLSSVERASIHADDTLGAFSDAGVSLQNAREGHSVAVIGDYLYVLGGYANYSYKGSVERALINADGTLGAFSDAGVSFQTPRALHGSAVIGDKLYVFGGSGQGGALTSIERATINADGTLGAFSDAGVALATARIASHAILLGNRLYVMDGLLGASRGIEHARLR